MNPVLKLIGSLASIGLGVAAAKSLDFLWTGLTGKKPPKAADLDTLAEASVRQTVAFAAVSAIVGAVVRVLGNRAAQRGVARYMASMDEV